MSNKLDADNSIRCVRTADMRALNNAPKPSSGGIAAHRQQIDLMLADAEKEYAATRRVNIEASIAAQARAETLRSVKQSFDIHCLKGGV
jgi:hypothetical protein